MNALGGKHSLPAQRATVGDGGWQTEDSFGKQSGLEIRNRLIRTVRHS